MSRSSDFYRAHYQGGVPVGATPLVSYAESALGRGKRYSLAFEHFQASLERMTRIAHRVIPMIVLRADGLVQDGIDLCVEHVGRRVDEVGEQAVQPEARRERPEVSNELGGAQQPAIRSLF